MYKDIINYELADGVSEAQLFEIAEKVLKGWMKDQSGFLGWEINKNADDGYSDIVSWESEDDAKKAEADMSSIPNADKWMGCYREGSIKSFGLRLVKKVD